MEQPVDRVTALGYKIPWDRYIGAGSSSGEDPNLFVDAEDVASIKACSTLPSPRLSELLASGDAQAQRYPQAMLRVLLNIRDVRILQYTLTLLCDFLQSDTERRVRLFLGSGERPLFALLQMVGTSGSGARITSTDANPYVLEHAARAAAIILSVDSSVQAGQASMLAWVQTNLRQMGSTSPKQVKVTEVAVESLMVLFRSDVIKSLFVEVSGTPSGDDPLNTLTAILSTPNSQILYDALHCLWLLSLGKRFHAHLQAAGAPLQVIRALRPGLPVKVQRMGVGFLVNLMKNPACLDTITLVVESAGISVLMEAFEAAVALAAGGGEGGGGGGGGSGSGKGSSSSGSSSAGVGGGSGAGVASSSSGPTLIGGDLELTEDVRWMKEAIAARGGRFGVFSSVERYAKELDSGVFHWTALHTPQFWKENAKEFERDGGSLLRQLARLITNPDSDDVTVAVALFDAGEFSVAHPQGKILCVTTGLKDAVLLHLEAKRKSMDDVKHQALMSMSKLIKTSA